MPDEFEILHGLDEKAADDNMLDNDNDGYTISKSI